MRIALLEDDLPAIAAPGAGADSVPEAVEAVVLALADLGHLPIRVAVGTDLVDWVSRLEDASPELALLLGGRTGRPEERAPRVAGVVELLDLRLAGSGSAALALARTPQGEAVLRAAGIPVAPPGAPTGGGARLAAGIVGAEVLGFVQAEPPYRLAPLAPDRAAAARTLARAAWRALGASGYGRIDLRIDPVGALAVVGVQLDPDLAPSAALARIATVRGWAYGELIEEIVRAAAAGEPVT